MTIVKPLHVKPGTIFLKTNAKKMMKPIAILMEMHATPASWRKALQLNAPAKVDASPHHAKPVTASLTEFVTAFAMKTNAL